MSVNTDTVNDFFGKLGAIYGRLNLSKPMQVFNCDKTGISVVHKPGKVVAKVGRRNVYAVISGEKRKTHNILSCVSASGYVLPPMPRKQSLLEKSREAAVANTLFVTSENGWIETNLFQQWFHFFLYSNIPPSRPVLLIMDGHSSHVSIDVIQPA